MLFIESNPIPVKWILNRLGRVPEGLRLPLTTLDEKYYDQMELLLSELSLVKLINTMISIRTLISVILLFNISGCSLMFDDGIDDYLKESESKSLVVPEQFKTCCRFLSLTSRGIQKV